jgi:hyperosmotically inducible periplasmic protein
MPRLLPAAVVLALAACGEPTPPPPPPPVHPAAPSAAAPAPLPAAKTPETPEADPNKALAARVKHALEEEAKIQAAAIDVTAAGGVVTLWGTAATSEERTRAAGVASKVEGVKSVENKIAVVRGS